MSIAIPLSGAADEVLSRLARSTGALAIAALDGRTLLGERAACRGYRVPGRVAAGGSCALLAAQDGWVALNLARPDDRALLPALFESDALDPDDEAMIADYIGRRRAAALLERARMMGLAMAGLHEPRPSPKRPCVRLAVGRPACGTRRLRPRVLDLSALWAGPLAAHLLWLAGAEVIKVESRLRPDAMRGGQPDFFALLNQGKASVVLDLHEPAGRTALLDLIAAADIVIEAARPRALEQLGIHANQLVAAHPGLIWLSITGHGATGEAAGWVGFGDDCGIAGGLGAAMLEAAGHPGFVGDAIADPLTGIFTALAGWHAWKSGKGGSWGLALRDVAATCLAQERRRDPAALLRELENWSQAQGAPFPGGARRLVSALPAFGADPPQWRGSASC